MALRFHFSAVLVCWSFITFGSPFDAQAARSKLSPEEREQKALEVARGHLKKAKIAFSLGEYDKAAKEWTYAYKFRSEPALLFNIAQAHRLSGKRAKARTLYENYLREAPNAANRAEVHRLIEAIPATEVDEPDPEPAKPKRRSKTEGETAAEP